MTQDIERMQLTPQTDLRDLVEQVAEDKTPRLLEEEGRPLAMVSPVDADPLAPAPAETVQAFYEKLTKRRDVREFLSRLARQ